MKNKVLVLTMAPDEADRISAMLRERYLVSCTPELEVCAETVRKGGCDIIVADFGPTDGIECILRLCDPENGVPLIALYDLDDAEMMANAIHEGAQDVFSKKELSAELLRHAVRYALERARMEMELSRERKLLRTLIDNVPDLIYVKDRQSRYILNNRAHMRFLGLDDQVEALGKTVFDYYPEEMARQFYEREQEIMASGMVFSAEEETRGINGREHWVATTKVPFRNLKGDVAGLVGISRDITRRKIAEQRLKKIAEEVSRKNDEMQDDLSLAVEFQQAILPEKFPVFPKGVDAGESRIRFCKCYQPCGAIGGDYFDVSRLDDHCAAVFICDVMGHGVRSALVTALLNGIVRELYGAVDDPGKFLQEVNSALLEILRRAGKVIFASAFYLIADWKNGEIRYATAGHPAPLLRRKASGTVGRLRAEEESAAPALGLIDGFEYPEYRTEMNSGDLLVLFTDGLFEVANSQGEEYGIDRVAAALEGRADLETREVMDQILADVGQHAAGCELTDDICMLSLEFA